MRDWSIHRARRDRSLKEIAEMDSLEGAAMRSLPKPPKPGTIADVRKQIAKPEPAKTTAVDDARKLTFDAWFAVNGPTEGNASYRGHEWALTVLRNMCDAAWRAGKADLETQLRHESHEHMLACQVAEKAMAGLQAQLRQEQEAHAATASRENKWAEDCHQAETQIIQLQTTVGRYERAFENVVRLSTGADGTRRFDSITRIVRAALATCPAPEGQKEEAK